MTFPFNHELKILSKLNEINDKESVPGSSRLIVIIRNGHSAAATTQLDVCEACLLPEYPFLKLLRVSGNTR